MLGCASQSPLVKRSAQKRRDSTAQRLVVTIDGPAGSGKSTAAKELARRLGLIYLDTGATYRVLAYATRQARLDPSADVKALADLARRLPLQFQSEPSGEVRVLLDGRDVTTAIRTEEVSRAAAQISRHPGVRRIMVRCQRKLADGRGVVAEGRDTGSVVFPRAAHKFFLDADPVIRAQRRQRELFQLSGSRPSMIRIRAQLRFRDQVDLTRRVGRLVKPADAVAIDTSRLQASQVVRAMLKRIKTQHRRPQSTVHRPQ